MSTTTANLGLFKYDTTNPTDLAAAFNINQALNNNWDIIDNAVSNSGSARNIGEIVTSTIPLTDVGLHLLDGALINGSGIYSEFVTYIKGLRTQYSSLFTTESDWQASVTQYGVCGKFVYDSTNNTVRLPKYSNKIFTGEGTAPVIGNGTTVGIDTGSLGNSGLVAGANGCLAIVGSQYGTSTGTIFPDTGIGNYVGITAGLSSDPSKSGLIADLSNITTSLDGYYYIVVATSTKTDIQVDIDEIATDLNGKADIDLSNCTKPHIVETYVNGTSWYRVYSDGWCEQGFRVNTQSQSTSTTYQLLKPMANTNYSCLYTENSASYVWSNVQTKIKIIDTSNIQVQTAQNGAMAGGFVEVKGYIR